MNKSAPKSCGLDPIPTSLLKNLATILAPVTTDIMNFSLASGEVPAEFKEALVTPLLKKTSLDPNMLNTTGLCQSGTLSLKSWKSRYSADTDGTSSPKERTSSVCLPHCSQHRNSAWEGHKRYSSGYWSQIICVSGVVRYVSCFRYYWSLDPPVSTTAEVMALVAQP